MARPANADLPPQLRELAAKAADQPKALKDALRASLASAAPNSTAEQVLVDACARLGYLPEEAERAAKQLLTEPPQESC